MAVRTVLQLGDPGLRVVARPVADPGSAEIRALVQDLADTLAHWRATTGYGRGIAAPQIAAGVRVIFLQLQAEPGGVKPEPWPLVNPEITWRSEEKIVVWDACLSFLSIFMQVERHREIRTFGRCARARSLRSDIGHRVLTPWRRLRGDTEDAEHAESIERINRIKSENLPQSGGAMLRPYLDVDQATGWMGPTTKTQAAAPSKVTALVITKTQKKLPVR